MTIFCLALRVHGHYNERRKMSKSRIGESNEVDHFRYLLQLITAKVKRGLNVEAAQMLLLLWSPEPVSFSLWTF